MVVRGSRIQGLPSLIKGKHGREALDPIPLMSKGYDEGWLQTLIEENPGLLPVDDIEPVFSPLISIGREVPTPAGNMDHLFISPTGYLTIVETKLWRNPEARREVVSQILDYAKDLQKWSFSDLDAKVKEYNTAKGNGAIGIIQSIRQNQPVDDDRVEEARLVDTISNNLSRGHFLLLIVGDGIRESVEDLVDYVNRAPQLHFTLGLIELQAFKLPGDDDGIVVIPQVVTRTREVVRAVVKVEAAPGTKVSVDLDVSPESASDKPSRRIRITEEDFFNSLAERTGEEDILFARQIIKDAYERGYDVDWMQSSFVVKTKDPGGSGKKITLFVVHDYDQVYVGWMDQQLESVGLPKEIGVDFAQRTGKLWGMKGNKNRHGAPVATWPKTLKLAEFRKEYPRFLDEIKQTLSEIAKAAGAIS